MRKFNITKKEISFEDCLSFINDVVDSAFVGLEYNSTSKQIGYLIALLKHYTDYNFNESSNYIDIFQENLKYKKSIELEIEENQLQFINDCIVDEVKVKQFSYSNQEDFFNTLKDKLSTFDVNNAILSTIDKLKNLDQDKLNKVLDIASLNNQK